MCRVSRNSGIINLLEPSEPVQASYRDSFTITVNPGGRILVTTQYNEFSGEDRISFCLHGAVQAFVTEELQRNPRRAQHTHFKQ